MKRTGIIVSVVAVAFVAYALTNQPSSASTNAGTRGTTTLPAPNIVILYALPVEVVEGNNTNYYEPTGFCGVTD